MSTKSRYAPRVTTPRWLDDDEQRAWLAYRRMRLLLDAQIARDLSTDSGLSAPDYDVLSNLSESDGHRLRVTDLAARLQWSKSRLSHHLSRMEHRRLISREDCSADGRGAFIVLTDEGWRTIKAAAPSHVNSVRRHFIDVLTPAQLEALTTISDTVVANLSDLAATV